MFSMVSFMVYVLQPGVQETTMFHIIYPVILGICSVFVINQFMSEVHQLASSESAREYFSSGWNFLDLLYLFINIFLLTVSRSDFLVSVEV